MSPGPAAVGSLAMDSGCCQDGEGGAGGGMDLWRILWDLVVVSIESFVSEHARSRLGG